LAVNSTTSEYVIRCDAHCIYPENFLSEIDNRLDKGDIDFATFTVESKGDSFLGELYALFMSSRAGVGNNTFRVAKCFNPKGRGAFGVYKRELLNQYQFEDIPTGEDYLMFTRLSKQYSYCLLNVKVQYVVRNTFSKILSQMYSYGYWKAYLIRHLKIPFTNNNIIALLIVPVYFSSFYFHQFYSILLVHLLFVLILNIYDSKKISLKVFLSSLLTIACHLVYSIGFLNKFITIKK
jgi:succinoglycan biosynthesis protein ExoA